MPSRWSMTAGPSLGCETYGAPCEKTFLLGVGAQKAGTSWLADYLSTVPHARAPFRKELHVFDVLYISRRRHVLRRMLVSLASQAARGIVSAALLRSRPIVAPVRAMGFYANPQGYFAYFERLLREDGARLTFDITPMYAGLPPATLRMIRDAFAQRGIATKAVFIARDPVERFLSDARMIFDQTLWQGRHRKAGETFEQFAVRWLDHPVNQIVGRYDLTLRALGDALAPETVWIDLYERFFTEPRFAEFARWLGPADTPALLDVRVFASNRQLTISDGLRQRIAERHAETYRYCDAYFGRDTIAALWPNRVLLD